MKTEKRRIFAAVSTLSFVVSVLTGCGNSRTVGNIEEESARITAISTAIETTTAEPTTEPIPEDKVVHVVAAGDNLIHYSVFKNAETYAGGNGYDFTPIYKEVKYLVESADIAVINQETVISQSNAVCGANGGVLIFNSPPEVADAVIDCGFDVITMANNHLLDMGAYGLEESINFWNEKAKENDLTVLGAYLNEEDMENIRIREVNGVKVAFLAYAEHLNGFSIPYDSSLRVVMNYEEDVIERQIKKAKEMADAVIVSAHWGGEDTHEVSEDRIELANKMVNWGADVILGGHTHTAQTMEWIPREDGTRGFVYYSMGNFVCAQTDNFNVIGEMPDFDIVVDGVTNEVTLENVKCIPTIVQYESPDFANMRIYPYSKYSEELANEHGLPYAYPRGTYTEFNWDVVNRIIEENFPSEFRALDK